MQKLPEHFNTRLFSIVIMMFTILNDAYFDITSSIQLRCHFNFKGIYKVQSDQMDKNSENEMKHPKYQKFTTIIGNFSDIGTTNNRNKITLLFN